MRSLFLVLIALGVLLAAPAATAHTRSASYSSWWLEADGARVRARISLLDLSVLERSGVRREALAEHVSRALTLSSSRGPCAEVAGSSREAGAPVGSVELEWRVRCPSTTGLEIRSQLLFDANPTHLHFVHVLPSSLGDGPSAGFDGVLDAKNRALVLPSANAGPAPLSGLVRFLRLGVEHIAGGWDHLVFVFMLVLTGATLRRTALVVSGFTVGHCITLTLATLGAVVPHAGPIEALIGLSIAVLAVENVWLGQTPRSCVVPAAAVVAIVVVALAARVTARPGALAFAGAALFSACYFGLVGQSPRPERLRSGVAAMFGLVHGFGFARVLQEMRLPAADLGRDLVGFNLGVELGQLAFILLAWPCVAWLRRRQGSWVAVFSAAGVALGSYWFVFRSLA
jgi:HupE / UreJ protein